MVSILIVTIGDGSVSVAPDVAIGLMAGIHDVLNIPDVVALSPRLFDRWEDEVDLVVFVIEHTRPMDRLQELISKGRALGARTVAWSLAYPSGMDFLPRQLVGADLVASADRASISHHQQDTKIIHLPPAVTAVPKRYLPKVRPIDLLLPSDGPDASRFRSVAVERPESLVVVPHHPHQDELLAVYEGQARWLRVLPRALAAVYEHSRLAPYNELYAVPRSTPNSRLWDIAANGIAPLMRDVTVEVVDYFEPGREFFSFSEWGELIDIIASPAGRSYLRDVGSAAWARTQADHCYANRFRQIMSALSDA